MRVLVSPEEAFKRVKRKYTEEDIQKRAAALLERVIRFMNFLRAHRFPVHTASEIDAAKALSLIDIDDPFQFYMALRSCLVITHTHIPLFNRLYMTFWGTGPRIHKPSEEEDEEAEEQQSSVIQRKLDEEPSEGKSRKSGKHESPEYDEVPAFTYSVHESLKKKDFEKISEKELPLLDELFKRMKLKIREKRGRRFKPSKRGRTIDFRRSMRDSTQHGGEIVNILKKERKPKETKIILLADVSGSMDIYSSFLIQFVYQLQRYLRETETFVFATRLMRITDMLQSRSVRSAMAQVAKNVHFWSGGTDIGGCFEEFNLKYGGKYSTKSRILVVLSDGWDKGDIELLRKQMIVFKRKFKKIIWLNPHLKYESYQPLCKGMATALPYVDFFLPCHNVQTLENFVEIVKRI
jgi:hypothetical protein